MRRSTSKVLGGRSRWHGVPNRTPQNDTLIELERLRTHPAWTFRRRRRQSDQLADRAAAARALSNSIKARESSDTLGGPTQTPLGQFFIRSYNVGAEQFQTAIPTPVLLNALARSLLSVRNAVVGSFTADGAGVRAGLPYKLISFLLSALLGLTRLLSAVGWAMAFAISTAVSVAALYVGFHWHGQLLLVNGTPEWTNIGWLVAAPAVVLAAELCSLWFVARGLGPWRQVLAAAGVLVALACVVLATGQVVTPRIKFAGVDLRRTTLGTHPYLAHGEPTWSLVILILVSAVVGFIVMLPGMARLVHHIDARSRHTL